MGGLLGAAFWRQEPRLGFWALGLWALGLWAVGVWGGVMWAGGGWGEGLRVWALGVWALGLWALGLWILDLESAMAGANEPLGAGLALAESKEAMAPGQGGI